jgi:hypothetical protein
MPDMKRNIIAFVYDFDGTLSPQPMQEYTVLPEIGVEPVKFWRDVNAEVKRTCGEDIITYMRIMYERANAVNRPFKRADLKTLGRKVQYFKGVEAWFSRMNEYVHTRSNGQAKLRHYIVSSGLREILEGASIFKEFYNIFASEYYFDDSGYAAYPNRVITDTTKTQYLFRINKGIEDLSIGINSHMPAAKRPIPFANMVYFGDGLTDVPSMAVTRQNGGYAIAVHSPGASPGACEILFEEKRCDFYAAADYRQNSKLCKYTQVILDRVIADIIYRQEAGL